MHRLFVILLAAASVSADVIYVSPTGSTGGDGTVSAPYDSVQRGINEAVAGDTVVLEDGTYHEHNLRLFGKEITVGSRYVLDGDTAHVAACVIDGDSVAGDSGSVFCVTEKLDSTALLAGLIITGGSGTDDGTGYRYGGGIYQYTDRPTAYLSCERCVITGNTARYGGGVFGGRYTRHYFTVCSISGNTAEFEGGALYGNRGYATLFRCLLSGNRSGRNGGAVYGYQTGMCILDSCLVSGNTADRAGGAGAGAYLSLSGCVVSGNRAESGGGGFYENPVLNLVDCRVDSNSSDYGGGAFSSDHHARLSGCRISGNSSAQDGGAFYNGSYVIEGCVISGNSAVQAGGGIAGGVDTLVRCLITGNTAAYGGALAFGKGVLSGCTIAGNTGTPECDGFQAFTGAFINCIIADTSYVEIPYSKVHLYYSSYIDSFKAEALEDDCVGYLFNADPKLVNVAGGDFHLLANSPAIDAGHPDSSYTNEPNCSGTNTRVNMGYYGNTAEATCAAGNAVLDISPLSFSRDLYQYEVRQDTFLVLNSGTDDMRIDAVVPDKPGVRYVGWGTNLVGPGGITYVALEAHYTVAAVETVAVQVVTNATNASITIPYEVGVSPVTGTDGLFMPRGYECGFGRLNDVQEKSFVLTNNGANPVDVCSLGLADTNFFSLDPVAEQRLIPDGNLLFTVRFKPVSALTYSTYLLVYSPHYARTDSILIQGTGADINDPVAVIDASLPDSVTWSNTIDFIDGGSTDMDEVGPQSPVRYVWTCGADTIGTQANINNYPADSFAIGQNVITLVVMDNESTWSAPVSDTFHLKGLPPVVDSIFCNTGLILSTHPTDTLTAFASDRDEFATRDVNDGDLTAIEWHSSIDGLLGTGMTYVMTPGDLSLGTHGFVCKVTDDEGDVAYSDTLWIPVQTAIGRAVLVAGTAFDDFQYFYNNINPNVNWAYKKLKDRGFTDEQIHYMNPVGWQSIGDPYADAGIVDETQLTKDNLHTHLTSLKSDVQNNVPLVLVFIGHGNAADQDGKFYLNNDDYLTPDDLGGWLDEYEDLDMVHSSITVILDFCYSGTFINKLRTIYDQNRYIVTASDDANAAYFVNGKSFSWNIFNQVYRGKSLKRAFESAKSWSDANAPGSNPANPRLNCNGNSASNEAIDFSLADKVYIGGSQELQAVVPEIVSAVGSVYVTGASTDSVRLAVTTSGEVANLWVRVIGPDFTMGSSIQDQPLVPFASTGVNSWAAVDTRYFVADEYLYLIEGADAAGNGLLGQGIPVSVEYSSAVTRYPGAVVTGAVTVQTQMYDGRTEFMVNGGVPGMVIRICRSDGSSATAIPVPVNGRCIWDGADREGRRIEDAVYFYSVDGPAGRVSGQFLFIR